MRKSVPGFALRQAACMDQARTERRTRIADAKLLYEYGRQEKTVGRLQPDDAPCSYFDAWHFIGSVIRIAYLAVK